MEQMLQRRIWILLTTPEGSVEFGTLSTDTLQNFANKVRDLSLEQAACWDEDYRMKIIGKLRLDFVCPSHTS